MTLSEINIRDPFILLHGDRYYLYGTRVGKPREGAVWGDQLGFDVYVSTDLCRWSGPRCVFAPERDFWGTRDFWAPEVHAYGGAFYMLASFKAEGRCRGTHVLRADSPEGPFLPVSPLPATPADRECLDGTLFTDTDGRPYMIFCHEWLQIRDGTVCAIPLSEDLSRSCGEPVLLWRGSDYAGSRNRGKPNATFVTDGPFLHRCRDGRLLAIWSTFGDEGYAELVCQSKSGGVLGPWQLLPEPLFTRDGGHGMIFSDRSGELHFIMHAPNTATLERPVILPLRETPEGLCLCKLG